jgi:hypothetical protein
MGWARWPTRPRQLEIDLGWIEEIGDRPCGVDLIVPSPAAGQA